MDSRVLVRELRATRRLRLVICGAALAVLVAIPGTAAAPQVGQQVDAGDYTIGSEDLLAITVFDEPPLSGRFRVDREGAISYPLLGRVVVGGLTPRTVEERLIALLAAGFLNNPQLSVEVEQYRSRSVFVIGEVRTPGKYPLGGDMSLIEALAKAGGTTPAASVDLLVVHSTADHAGAPLLPEQARDADVDRINLADLQSGKARQNVMLRDGDTIYVPKAELFFITGEVRAPGSYAVERGMTVLQALSLAGGLTQRGSDRRIKVVRLVEGRKREVGVTLSDLVQAGDTLVVPQRFF